MSQNLSFEEFHALHNRKRANKGQKGDAGADKEVTSEKAAPPAPAKKRRSARETLGEFIESFEVQFVVIVLIGLDLIAVTTEYFITRWVLCDPGSVWTRRF